MPPFRITAQQYSACWRERILKEQQTLAEHATAAPATAAAPAPAEAAPEDEALSSLSVSALSHCSSRASNASVAARKVERLTAMLAAESKLRRELEVKLKNMQY